MCYFYFKKMQCFKLTRRRAHPVGAKARIAANKSDIVSPHTTNKIVMIAMKARNRSTLRILSMSRNLVLNVGLSIDTT
jgi:ribosomal protein L32E